MFESYKNAQKIVLESVENTHAVRLLQSLENKTDPDQVVQHIAEWLHIVSPELKTYPEFKIGLEDIHNVELYTNWDSKMFGFGQMSVSFKDGIAGWDAEGMGRETTRKILYALVDELIDKTHTRF